MNIHRYTQYMYSYPHKTAYRALEGVSLADHLSCLAGSGHSLYLHIPFCQAKCGYCNLFSVTGQDGEAMDRYLDAVERQLGQYEQYFSGLDTEFSELTLGGGTPLLLSVQQLERIFHMIRNHLNLSTKTEIIIETAPNQTDVEKLELLREAGVTRVSMGIQSFFDEELRVLRRNHQAEKARQSLRLLMDSGFPCVNVDFIYGVPGQSVESFLASVREAADYQPQELFLYPLYLKHGAYLERRLGPGFVLDEELAYRQYREAAAWLRANGYRQDSMRRFVRSGASGSDGQLTNREFADCGFGTTLSLGCGGRSYLGNLHCCTPYAVNQCDSLKQLRQYEETEDFGQITHGFVLSEDERKRRYVIRHLLILPGLDERRYREYFHSEARIEFPELEKWLTAGYLERRGDYLALTDEGLGLSDYLGPQLISPEVRARMREWEVLHGTGNASIPGESKEL